MSQTGRGASQSVATLSDFAYCRLWRSAFHHNLHVWSLVFGDSRFSLTAPGSIAEDGAWINSRGRRLDR